MNKWKVIDNPKGDTFQGQVYKVISCIEPKHSYQIWEEYDYTVGVCAFCQHMWLLPSQLYKAINQPSEEISNAPN